MVRELPCLILLAPYDAGVWSDVRQALDASSVVMIGDIGVADDIGSVARHILQTAPERFCVAGLCMGGHVAFELIRTAGQRITGLAFVNSSAAADTRLQERMRRERIEKLTQKAEEADFPALSYAEYAANWLVAQENGDTKRAVQKVQALIAGVPILTSLNHQIAMLGREDCRALLSAINVPTIVIAGQNDRVCPPEQGIEIGSCVPGARVHILKPCGHIAPVERPQETAALMTNWLRRVA